VTDRSEDPLLVDVEGHTECLLGNEAIVRGALESGVAFAAGYPGTPSSEVTDSFARVAEARGIKFEYSVNEKIAIEMCFGASLAGARSICAMKHLGLMYGGDPLSTIPYVGTVGGMVIVSAGDPSCRTSPNEQDQRMLAPMLHIPMLDPSTPKEACEMTRFAFELSEKSRLPVVIRPTTRVCHSRQVITFRRLQEPKVTGFVRDPQRFVPVPQNARRLRIELKDRLKTAERMLSESEFLRVEGRGDIAVLASGAPAGTCADLLLESGLLSKLKLITLGSVYPLPESRLVAMLSGVKRLLVVEELSPYLEDSLTVLCSRNNLPVEILGKRTGHFPVEFEYDPEMIREVIHDELKLGPAARAPREVEPVTPRPPTLCPGCPHRAAQFAARTVFGDSALYFNDIGCYTLGYGPPLNTADALLCMGAGFTLAAGVSRVTGERTVGIMGDSTFFHSGMTPLLNAVKENVNMVAVILDNLVTAMTGFQKSPLVELSDDNLRRTTSIESVVRALGARHVEVVDPHDLPATITAFERARDATGVSVVITQRACPVYLARETHQAYKIATYRVDSSRCQTCGREELGLRCSEGFSEGFQQHMARSRAMESGEETEPRPASAPCSDRCPLGLCIQGFVGQIAGGQYQNAYNIIVSQICLPETVCRVCHQPCQEVCIHSSRMDEPVAINELKRFAVEWAVREGVPYEPERDPPSSKKVAVVGTGPSGLSAAHDLLLRGHAVTLYDSAEKPGGLLRTGIPPYRLPREALERDIQRILSLGAEFVPNTALGKNLTLQDLLLKFDAVYLGIGAQKWMKLKLEGKTDGPPIVDAMEYLESINQGQPIPTARRVVVVGGGNAAVDAARTALRQGAKQVLIAYRRRREDMPAINLEITAARREDIELRTQLMPIRVRRGELICLRTEPGDPDESGRGRPVPVMGSEESLECDQIIAAIGQAPDPELPAQEDIPLDREPDGSIRVNPETQQTSQEKVFAGGDVVLGSKTVTDAMATGRRAAWGIDRLLRGKAAADRRPPPPRVDFNRKPATRPGVDRADRMPRQQPVEIPPSERTRDFTEVVLPFKEHQAKAEAARCMVCGLCGNCRTCIDLFGCPAFYVEDNRIHIDTELCMGCGVCAEICPNSAIVRVEESQEDRTVEPAFGPVESPEDQEECK
jgi:indolepyruvate ferredoxin oxidoreductase alpha subunit